MVMNLFLFLISRLHLRVEGGHISNIQLVSISDPGLITDVCLLMFKCRHRRWSNFMANGCRIEQQQITSASQKEEEERNNKREKSRRKELDQIYHEHTTRNKRIYYTRGHRITWAGYKKWAANQFSLRHKASQLLSISSPIFHVILCSKRLLNPHILGVIIISFFKKADRRIRTLKRKNCPFLRM